MSKFDQKRTDDLITDLNRPLQNNTIKSILKYNINLFENRKDDVSNRIIKYLNPNVVEEETVHVRTKLGVEKKVRINYLKNEENV